jgi:hypothetical protein
MDRRDIVCKEWSAGDETKVNRGILSSGEPSIPRVNSLRHVGKSKSFTLSKTSNIGPEDDRVFAERLARLCLAKYPSLSAIPAPKKFEEQKFSSARLKRTYSAPVNAGASRDQVSFALPTFALRRIMRTRSHFHVPCPAALSWSFSSDKAKQSR